MTFLFAVALSVGSLLAGSGPAAATGTTRWVNDDDPNGPPYMPPGTSCNNPGYQTITLAVTFAAPGDTIFVCQGTYPENVTITKALRVTGAGVGATRVTGVPATAGPIFEVMSAGFVTIEKLTVDGMSAQAGGTVWGIRYANTDGVVKNVEVLNIRDTSGAAQGIGIRVDPTSKVLIERSLVKNFTRVGISGNGLGARLTVKNNTVVGPVTPKVWAPNGVQISRGATASVTGNSVRDATSPVPDAGGGSGILLFCAGPTSVEGNWVKASDVGVAIADNQNGSVKGNVVWDSVFDAYSLQFIGNLFGPLGCPGTFPSITRDNVLRQNLGVKSGENGVSLANFDVTVPAPPISNDILGNYIRVSGIDGIRVFQGEDNYFIGNNIAISDEHDCHDDTTGGRTAGTANTWRDNRGSTSDPPGLCRDRHHGDGDDDDDDDDDYDKDGKDNKHDDDDDGDGRHDDDDDDDDNDGFSDDEDFNDDNDGLMDAVDDVEVFTIESLLELTIPSASQLVKVNPQ